MVGSFFLARRLLMLPTELIASTVSDVSYSLIATNSVEEIHEHVSSWLRKLWLLAALTLVAGVAAAPVASYVVGDQYEHVGIVVLLMAPTAAVQLVGTSMANVLLALHLERLRMALNVLKIVAICTVFVVAWPPRPHTC